MNVESWALCNSWIT